MTQSKPAANALIFSFPSRSRQSLTARLIAITGLWAFFISAELYRTPDPLTIAAATIFFGWIAMLDLRLLRVAQDRIAVDMSGIWYLPSHGPSQLIAWQDIQTVKSHQINRYLEVTDIGGTNKIKVEYGLDKFDTLRHLITERHIPAI